MTSRGKKITMDVSYLHKMGLEIPRIHFERNGNGDLGVYRLSTSLGGYAVYEPTGNTITASQLNKILRAG